MTKKRTRVKKSNNLLKGVASAGAVVGGGMFLQNTNVVYAAGLEDEQVATATNEFGNVIESQLTTESNTTSLSESTNSQAESGSESSNSENSASNNEANSESNAIMLAELDSEEIISSEESEYFATFNTISNNIVKDSLSISSVRSELLSQSVSLSEYASENAVASSESEFLSNSAFLQSQYEIESNYNSAYQDFNDERNEVLEETILKIEEYKVRLDEAQKQGYHSYCSVANEATVFLAKYYFFQSYGTGEITNNYSQWRNWDSEHGYQRNNLYLEYKDANGDKHVGFFDWVTLDANGYVTQDSSKINDLVVIKKSPVYTFDNNGASEKLYYYQSLDGITHVYHGTNNNGIYNYEEVTDLVDVTETGERTVSFTYNGQTFNAQMENGVFPEFAALPNVIHDGSSETIVKGYPYASIKGYDNKEDQYASQRVNYESASTAKSQFESQSTSISQHIEYESASKQAYSESVSNSVKALDSTIKSQQESLYSESESKSHSFVESKSNSVVESQSTSKFIESQSLSESAKFESLSKSAVAESESLSQSKSTEVATSESLSKVVASESTSNSIVESTSIKNSESLSTDQSLSESNSIVKSESESQSTSKFIESQSLSESAKFESLSKSAVAESESLSQSKSTEVATSESLSKVVASESTSNSIVESTSIKNSESLSTDQSLSESLNVSENESDSISASLSESNSISLSESESVSVSISESESISSSLLTSQSASALLSESVSTSMSESLSNGVLLSVFESTSNSTSYTISVVADATDEESIVQNIVVDTRPAPLQVVRDDMNQTEIVEEDTTPKASLEENLDEDITPIADMSQKVFWSWIPILGTIAALKDTYSKRKEVNDEIDDDFEDEE